MLDAAILPFRFVYNGSKTDMAAVSLLVFFWWCSLLVFLSNTRREQQGTGRRRNTAGYATEEPRRRRTPAPPCYPCSHARATRSPSTQPAYITHTLLPRRRARVASFVLVNFYLKEEAHTLTPHQRSARSTSTLHIPHNQSPRLQNRRLLKENTGQLRRGNGRKWWKFCLNVLISCPLRVPQSITESGP